MTIPSIFTFRGFILRSVAMALLGVALATIFLIRKKRRKSLRSESSSEPFPVPVENPNPFVVVGWPNPPTVGKGISESWSEFVKDRLEEQDPSKAADETKWALGVVDFLDELKEADAEASVAEQVESASLCASLLTVLSSKGYEPVDSDEWNPDKQRAVSVVRKTDATGTKILGKGSTGLSRDGKIIRKQEVKIEMKGN